MKKTLLAGFAALSLLAPALAFGQAYTPNANDTLWVNAPTHERETVNAKTYIKTQANAANNLCTSTAPTIGTTFGTADSVVHFSSACALSINIGTSNTGTGVITLPAAPHGWICTAVDITTTATTQAQIKQIATGSSTTACALQNYSDVAVAHAMTDSDILYVTATPF